MSQPSLPNITPNITLTRDDAVNLVLSSIAMEELGLSHILNAEGEKLQYVLGTLPGLAGPPATISDLLAVNSSVKDMINTISKNEFVLQQKLETVTSIPLSVGPAGPTGPTGPAGFAEYGGYYLNEIIGPLVNNQNIPLPTAAQANGAISSTGTELLLPPGVYLMSYSVTGNLSIPVELRDNGVTINATRMISNNASTGSNTIIYQVTNSSSPIGLYYIGSEPNVEVMYANIIVSRVN